MLVETPAPLTSAQWKFIKYAAIFYHQAEKDSALESFFILVNRLYYDRWPEEGYEEKVRPLVFGPWWEGRLSF